MNKLYIVVIAVVMVIGGAGCSEQVPPGHGGKILGPNGYSAEVLSEGRHWVGWREELVLLDLTTNRQNSGVTVTMKDYGPNGDARPGLDMDFTVSYRYRLRNDPAVINTMFSDVKVDPGTGVTASQVFNIYAGPIITTAFRDVVSGYTPEEALSNRSTINKAVSEEIRKRLNNSPIVVSDVVVTRFGLPKTITDRIRANKDRELKIVEEQAQQAIELTKRENAIVLARKDAEKDLIDAQAAAAQNRELMKGLNKQVLELRRLEIAQTYAEAFSQRIANGKDGDTLILPYEAMSSVGGQMKMFAGK